MLTDLAHIAPYALGTCLVTLVVLGALLWLLRQRVALSLAVLVTVPDSPRHSRPLDIRGATVGAVALGLGTAGLIELGQARAGDVDAVNGCCNSGGGFVLWPGVQVYTVSGFWGRACTGRCGANVGGG